MAKFNTGALPAFRGGAYLMPGTDIVIPDDELPSKTWEPLDDAAKASSARLKSINKGQVGQNLSNVVDELKALQRKLGLGDDGMTDLVGLLAELAARKAQSSPPPPPLSVLPPGAASPEKPGAPDSNTMSGKQLADPPAASAPTMSEKQAKPKRPSDQQV